MQLTKHKKNRMQIIGVPLQKAIEQEKFQVATLPYSRDDCFRQRTLRRLSRLTSSKFINLSRKRNLLSKKITMVFVQLIVFLLCILEKLNARPIKVVESSFVFQICVDARKTPTPLATVFNFSTHLYLVGHPERRRVRQRMDAKSSRGHANGPPRCAEVLRPTRLRVRRVDIYDKLGIKWEFS